MPALISMLKLMTRTELQSQSRITNRLLKLALVLGTALMLAGCGASPLRFPGVYRLSIPQGNIITQDQVDQLRPGLTKRQVTFILGTPLIKDTFNQDRWDYIYSFQPGGGERVQERLTVYFDAGRLDSFEGDFRQSPDKEQFGQTTETEQGTYTVSAAPST